MMNYLKNQQIQEKRAMAQQMALKQYNKLRTDVTQSGKLEMQNKYIADGLNQIANQLDKDSTEHKLHEGLKTWNKVKQDMELKQSLSYGNSE